MTSLEPRRTAVIAVHLQHDFVDPEGVVAHLFRAEMERTGVLPTAARILDAARSAGVQVFYTRIAFQPGHLDLVANSPLMGMAAQLDMHVEGTQGAAVVDAVKPQAGDHVVTHQRLTGFHGSELDVLLRGSGIDTAVFIGVATNLSVEGTARTASDLGYRTIVVSDACASHSEAAHNASLQTLSLLAEIMTADELLAAIAP